MPLDGRTQVSVYVDLDDDLVARMDDRPSARAWFRFGGSEGRTEVTVVGSARHARRFADAASVWADALEEHEAGQSGTGDAGGSVW